MAAAAAAAAATLNKFTSAETKWIFCVLRSFETILLTPDIGKLSLINERIYIFTHRVPSSKSRSCRKIVRFTFFIRVESFSCGCCCCFFFFASIFPKHKYRLIHIRATIKLNSLFEVRSRARVFVWEQNNVSIDLRWYTHTQVCMFDRKLIGDKNENYFCDGCRIRLLHTNCVRWNEKANDESRM